MLRKVTEQAVILPSSDFKYKKWRPKILTLWFSSHRGVRISEFEKMRIANLMTHIL